MKSGNSIWNPVQDLQAVCMADRRHARRVVAVTKRAMAAPGASFPRMMHDDGELEGAYRLFSNPDVSPHSIFEAHYAATARRVRGSYLPTIVVHDTTDCCFGGDDERVGIGRVSNKGKGLSVHVALALSPDGAPHGLLDVSTHTRLNPPVSKKKQRKYNTTPHSKRESARWGKTVERAMNRLGDGPTNVVHVMDREADSYRLFQDLMIAGRAFVIRLAQNRRIADDDYDYLRDAIEHVDATLTREAPLCGRSDRNRHIHAKKTHPARNARTARLAIGARTVTFPVNRRWGHVERKQLELNVVRVWEPEPPDGQTPVEWVLVTNLPATSPDQLAVIVDVYRTRWTIEEYFKALKTGCAFERRQLESRHALENALAILAPIACRLLLLRTLAHRNENSPATDVLTTTQIDILRVLSKRHRIPPAPSVRDALLAIAGLGGFLKRNGEPGWQTIGLGFDELLQAEVVWRAAKSMRRCDLS